MLRLLKFLFKYSPFLVGVSIVAAVITGAANTALLALIQKIITSTEPASDMRIWQFVGLVMLLPLCRIFSQISITVLSQRAVMDLRVRLSRQILGAPLRELEKHGPNKLLSSITGDVATISNTMGSIPYLLMNVTVFLGCVFYLMYLYWLAGLVVLATAVIGLIIFQLLSNKGNQHFARARRKRDSLFKHFRALTDGAKEMKLHRERRQAFFGEWLEKTSEELKQDNVTARTWFAGATSFGEVLFFIAIGISILILPAQMENLTPEAVTGYALVLLYMIVPLNGITSIAPTLGMALVGLRKLDSLGLSLQKVVSKDEGDIPNASLQTWQDIQFKGITHTYYREKEDQHFTMGPMDLNFKPGEVVFIVGGNGSGKTTLAKMIIGLYAPEDGEVKLNGQLVDDSNRDTFRQLFSAVFTDFFIWDDMLGLDKEGLAERVDAYLKQLHLDHKVTFEDGSLSTTALSQGQRKRLALLTAYLEDRPIYLFDEWAADQDPVFKDVFYRVLVPELKKKGKTVLAITHDDHYFDFADRIIKLDAGQIELDRPAKDVAHEIFTRPKDA